jgi:2-amino-4-hydroxy-6-hydroxymethyldihydropteridine diphosphokinase
MTPDPPARGRLLVAVGMGSNQPPVARSPFDLDPPSDPRARALEGALVLLRQSGHQLKAASPLFETRPQDVDESHGPYVNACVLIETDDDLPRLLADCEAIEIEAGRTRKGDMSPRPLDLDLLAAWRAGDDGRLVPVPRVESERLTLPHPRLAQRPFVLMPLAGVMPDAPLVLGDGQPARTPWQLLRSLAKDARGVAPGPPSASFPYRGAGARGDQIELE